MQSHRAGQHEAAGQDGSWAHVPMEMAEWYILGIAEGERRAAERSVGIALGRRRDDREPPPTTAELRLVK